MKHVPQPELRSTQLDIDDPNLVSNIERLPHDALDALPFGVVQLDRTGNATLAYLASGIEDFVLILGLCRLVSAHARVLQTLDELGPIRILQRDVHAIRTLAPGNT